MEEINYVIGEVTKIYEKESVNGNKYRVVNIVEDGNDSADIYILFKEEIELKENDTFKFKIIDDGKGKKIDSIEEIEIDYNQKKITETTKTQDIKKQEKSKKNINTKDSYFNKLNSIECEIEKKGMFNYVSWAEAWQKLKLLFPNSTFKIYEKDDGMVHIGNKNIGYFVKVGVTVEDIEHIEIYPILDNNNNPIKQEEYKITKFNKEYNVPALDSFNINTSIKRALAKAIALHGLGLYVFKGEDIPRGD